MVHPYLRRRSGEEPIIYPNGRPAQRAGAHLRRADLPGAGDAAGRGGGRLHAGRGRPAAPRDGRLEAPRRHRTSSSRSCSRACAQRGYDRELRATDRRADPRLRRLRLSRVACRQLRAAGLCVGLAQAPLSGGLHRGAAQQPADGVLCSPAQLLRDARAHGVEVRPVDVRVSDVDCTLEPGEAGEPCAAARAWTACARSVRLPCAAHRRLHAAWRPFASVQDLGDRGALSRARPGSAWPRPARWRASTGIATWPSGAWPAISPPLPTAPDAVREAAQPLLRAPTEAEDMLADYRSAGLHAGPASAGAAARRARGSARAQRPRQLRAAARWRNGAAWPGLVTTRQRPQTASGVTFVTLEDESGQVNVVVWRQLGERRNACWSARG